MSRPTAEIELPPEPPTGRLRVIRLRRISFRLGWLRRLFASSEWIAYFLALVIGSGLLIWTLCATN